MTASIRISATRTAYDLFAGPGGADVALAALGFETLGFEYDASANATARAAGFHRIEADIATLNPHDYASPTLVHGSPPCPGFSSAGKGEGRKDLALLIDAIDEARRFPSEVDRIIADVAELSHDWRSPLTLEPLRWVAAHLPEYVSLEQVPAVLPVWEAYADALRAWGYSAWTDNVTAEQYGVPQTRKRAVLLASRSSEVTAPAPTHSKYYSRTPAKLDEGVAKWVSMAEALGWGMTQRPSYTVTGGGAATGGAEPFGNASRQGMRREVEAGRWVFVNGSQPRAAVRPLDHPAPTMAFGHDSAGKRWATTNRSDLRPARPHSPGGTARHEAGGGSVMNPYAAAALVTWAAGTVVCAAFWIGRGKLINDYKQYVADRARDEYVNREIASLDKKFEVRP